MRQPKKSDVSQGDKVQMTVDCAIEDTRWSKIDFEVIAKNAVTATLRDRNLDPSDFEVSILACNDARIAGLNGEFRSKDKATNVLSWPSQERGASEDGVHPEPPEYDQEGPTELGDIAIAYDTCVTEAAAAGKGLTEHTTHLLVHATLHLLGYDHIREAEGDLMEACETQILGKMGLSDPYSD